MVLSISGILFRENTYVDFDYVGGINFFKDELGNTVALLHYTNWLISYHLIPYRFGTYP